MMFRLAGHLGRTVAELDASITMEELYEWEAYYQIEPWGCQAEDDRWRQSYALTFAINAAPGAAQPEWLDRMPGETARRHKIAAQTPIEDKIEAFFAAHEIATREEVETEWRIVDGVIVEVPVNEIADETPAVVEPIAKSGGWSDAQRARYNATIAARRAAKA